ncbi:MAG: pyridoxal phosphate-dependent aminotransferase [Calditrichaeota bacterium]|nr:pyridoxal phosphate-dependent aminotransferase [Calditrichota bacterium]
MPSPSSLSRQPLPPTVWNQIESEAARQAAIGRDVVCLHVGDAHRPFPAALLTPVEGEDTIFGQLNRYGDTYGERALREALIERAVARGLPIVGIEQIQITAGATGGLYSAFSRLMPRGAEVLTPAPYWSILRQVADAAGVHLIEVPFFDRLAAEPSLDPASLLESHLTERTAGIYLNTPSNPTGMLLGRDLLMRLADFAGRNDLWIFSDEAYQDFVWSGDEHVSIGSLPGTFERTVTVGTASKCFGASGMRVGWVMAPAWVVSQINRGVVGSVYQAGRSAQLMAWRGLQRFTPTVGQFRDDYGATYQWASEAIEARTLPCLGGFYFWVELGDGWEQLSAEDQVGRMLEAGVALAPGEYFGRDYRNWARLCFTVVPPDRLREGVARLNRLLG